MAADTEPGELQRTPLHDLHVEIGGRMVPFAGYSMPVQYEGILAEHRWTREHAGLFDVSHMGQALLTGPDHDTTARALEALIPADILGLRPGRQRYSQLTSENGGILDDLMVTRPAAPEEDGTLLLVVNAGTKETDYAHLAAGLGGPVRLLVEDGLALLALQGPKAADVLKRLAPEVAELAFMSARRTKIAGVEAHVSRSGYTGEDGFEISVDDKHAADLWRLLIDQPEVKPIGLGARDSLRLEAGLCLHGHDIDATTSPVEAGLAWSIQKRRRQEGGFPGAERILRELSEGPSRKRGGIRPEGRAPIREGAELFGPGGTPIGKVTSGGFGPTLNAPVAMGYVAAPYAEPGTKIVVSSRRGEEPAEIAPLPFIPPRYVRSP
ncbi:MAG: glycine cleavage system aminomethyltransferase GcvT [Pseudomonadota bacterium]|nr:glycine cleavage system aminomethyltransferase GcvT [Pseudomonadota bacterium]